jgi:hypothetical protein
MEVGEKGLALGGVFSGSLSLVFRRFNATNSTRPT